LIKKKQFQKGNWILLYDSKYKNFKGKFHTCWLGPYEVARAVENGFVEIKIIDEHGTTFLVNRH